MAFRSPHDNDSPFGPDVPFYHDASIQGGDLIPIGRRFSGPSPFDFDDVPVERESKPKVTAIEKTTAKPSSDLSQMNVEGGIDQTTAIVVGAAILLGAVILLTGGEK